MAKATLTEATLAEVEQVSVENALQVTQSTSLVATQEVDLRGFEDVELESIKIPTAKLLQAMSPELTDDTYADYNFKAGQIVHSLLMERLSEEFVPLKMHDDKICFIPKNDTEKQKLKYRVGQLFGVELTDEDMNSMFLCRSQDNKTGDRFGDCSQCGLCNFNGNEKPFCNKNINVLALFKDQEMPVVIRFSNTSHKHGQQFKSVAYAAGTALLKRKYKLLSTKKTDKGNTWYEMSARPFGKTEGEDLARAEALYSRFAKVSYSVDEDMPMNEATPAQTEY